MIRRHRRRVVDVAVRVYTLPSIPVLCLEIMMIIIDVYHSKSSNYVPCSAVPSRGVAVKSILPRVLRRWANQAERAAGGNNLEDRYRFPPRPKGCTS